MELKNAKKVKEKYRDTFTAQEVAVILEDIKGDNKIIFEKLDSLDDKVNKLQESVDILAINQGKLELGQQYLKDGQKRLIERVDSLEKNLKALEISMNNRFDSVEADIKEIKESLKQYVDFDKFVELEKRVTILNDINNCASVISSESEKSFIISMLQDFSLRSK